MQPVFNEINQDHYEENNIEPDYSMYYQSCIMPFKLEPQIPYGFPIIVPEYTEQPLFYPPVMLCRKKQKKPKFNDSDINYLQETEEARKNLFDATITGFVLRLFEIHQNTPLSEGYIVEQVRANLAKLKRPDGTKYKGNLYKTVKGSLTSNGIFRIESRNSSETQWVVCQRAAEEFEKRTISRIDHLASRKRHKNRKECEYNPAERIVHKHSHVYRMLNGFLESQQQAELKTLLEQINDFELEKHKNILKNNNMEQVQQGVRECYEFFKEICINFQYFQQLKPKKEKHIELNIIKIYQLMSNYHGQDQYELEYNYGVDDDDDDDDDYQNVYIIFILKNKDLSFRQERKKQNRDEFYDQIEREEMQGVKFQTILQNYDENEILDELENFDLIKTIEYLPLEFDSLKYIIRLLKLSVQAEDEQIVEIILQSDLFKNLIYQMCLIIYDQNEWIQFRRIVILFKKLLSILKKSHDLIDLRLTSIIFPIELIELVDQDYPNCELAALFNDYHQLKESLKEYDYSNDYKECPVQPLMLEFDFKTQVIGNLQTTKFLNYHFFILREDYLRDFREFIYKFKTNNFQKKDKQFPMYQEAQLIDFYITNKALIWTIKMKQYNMDGRKRKVLDWKKSKRLITGTLLAFTNLVGYPIVFGVIMERKDYQHNYNKYFEIQLSIKLLSNDILQFLDLFRCTNVIIENPIIYDVSTSYLLSLKTTKLPFKDIIIKGSKNVEMPNYISNFNYQIHIEHQSYDNNDIYDLHQFQNHTISMNLRDPQWQNQGSLDQSQMNALKLMLSTEIALIQGPPGTGKTYCGALAVRNLLENVKMSSLPILVVCYTNHALDQFLNHILNYVNHRDVLRLGFRSKDPNIIPCMIQQVKTKINFHWSKFFGLKYALQSLVDKILDSKYTVYRKDIEIHWPELYESIVNDECVENITDIDEIFRCWFEDDIPDQNSSSEFYNSNCQLQQIQQINRYQPIQQIDQIEMNIDMEEDDTDVIADTDPDEYLDSEEEEEARYFREEYTQENRHHSNHNYIKTIVNRRIPYDHQGIADLQNSTLNPWQLNRLDIEGIQDYISHLMLLQDIQKYSSLAKQFEEMSSDLKSKYQEVDSYQFNQKKIIGVTITGAAKYTEKLKQLNTKILVIEEAAEVLESHLISILTPNIQHLILIGDHQQLKPKLSCYELEQEYGANTSLFEKLFRQGIKNVTLTCQRRMKPKFADFIRLIYGNTYQDNIPQEQINKTIDGMNSDLVYFNHSWYEERDANSTSTLNRQEANMIIALVIYLVGCKHKQETISVITLYLKQAMSIKKVLLDKGFKGVKVQTVDNYQGEENEIVIVSLVRSNKQGYIGFVKLENRINVALSRARLGLYVFGNFKCIQQKLLPSHLWNRIIELAKKKEVMKDHLQLCCLRHKKQRQAKTPEQMTLFNPGCCDQICGASFPDCTHRCSKICHIGDHKVTDCPSKCQRQLVCGHRCTAKCKDNCFLVECQVKVEKKLPCLHKAVVECYKPENSVSCEQQVSQSYPCGHTLKFKCGDKNKYIFCQAKCDKKLPCGHKNFCRNVCSQECSECNIGVTLKLQCGHSKEFCCYQVTNKSYLKINCQQFCNKVLACGHPNNCQLPCFQACQPCSFEVPKTLPCEHPYPFKCSQLINGNYKKNIKVQCEIPVNKLLPCGHNLRMICYESANPVICEQICIKRRTCGHAIESACVHPCHESCPPCIVMVPKPLQCGHQVNVQCFKYNRLYREACMQACKKQLTCGHPNQCTKLCSSPCDPCREMSQKVLPCGHVYQVQCSQKNYQFSCNRPCPKTVCAKCSLPFTCSNICGKPCQPCNNSYLQQFPCGHSKQVRCGQDYIQCYELISKKKSCGQHYEDVPCYRRNQARSYCDEHCVIF